MDRYQSELQRLKPDDEVQMIEKDQLGYNFIYTAGHGYLCVPRADRFYKVAQRIREYGYQGTLAVYLEEDCEVPEFFKKVKAIIAMD